MKVSIGTNIKDGPWGGGSLFALNFMLSFRLKPNNYTAAFEPKFQDLTAMKNGTITSDDTEHSQILWDAIKGIFEVEFEGKNALKQRAAYDQGVNYSDVSIPTANDFIPKSLGGKLKNYEDYLAATQDAGSANASMAAYSQASFKPHYMYRKQGTDVSTVFATTYQEHVDLANLGYGHNYPA